MELKNLPDLTFTESDSTSIADNIITVVEGLLERTLGAADPLRLFLMGVAAIIVQQRILIDQSAKQNLLAYATGDYLDHLGVLVGTDRIGATAATTTMKLELSAARMSATIIPAGTRFTPGNGVYFALDEDTVIDANDTTTTAAATCTETGDTGNNYGAGEINTIVDPVAFLASASNVTVSEGGTDTENDTDYRTRINEAPEKFSVAGPSGAYTYHTKQVSALIADASVTSPAPGEVVVIPLLTGGGIPGNEILSAISEALNNESIRPLTDKVTVKAPEVVNYNINVTYYIDRDDATESAAIQAAVEKAINAYAIWQKSKLGRDINQTELYYRIRAAGAKRAAIEEPENTVISKTQIAVADSTNIIFGGLEDG